MFVCVIILKVKCLLRLLWYVYTYCVRLQRTPGLSGRWLRHLTPQWPTAVNSPEIVVTINWYAYTYLELFWELSSNLNMRYNCTQFWLLIMRSLNESKTLRSTLLSHILHFIVNIDISPCVSKRYSNRLPVVNTWICGKQRLSLHSKCYLRQNTSHPTNLIVCQWLPANECDCKSE